jgi:hypothetical protein
MDKKTLMTMMNITEDDITYTQEVVLEKLFCVAVINQGAEIASNILKDYLEMKKIINQ